MTATQSEVHNKVGLKSLLGGFKRTLQNLINKLEDVRTANIIAADEEGIDCLCLDRE